MKIKITEERDCCQSQDLLPYNGRKNNADDHFLFCKHCGQIWLKTKEMGPAGSMEPSLERVIIYGS